jgi:aspartate oxidase
MKFTKNQIEKAMKEMLSEMTIEERAESYITWNYMAIIKQNDNLTIDRVKDFESKHKYLKNSMNANKINITQYSNLMAQELNKLKN